MEELIDLARRVKYNQIQKLEIRTGEESELDVV
jgi:hypothetical protein